MTSSTPGSGEEAGWASKMEKKSGSPSSLAEVLSPVQGDMGSGPGRGPKSRTMLTARPQKSKGLLGLSQAELSLNSRTEAPTPSTSDVTVFRDGPLKEVIKIK